jgi:hypothetical protein
MSYTDCVSRIVELDTLIRNMDPAWATSGYSMADALGAGDGSTFASVLESLAGTQTAAADDTTQTASPSALGGPGTLGGGLSLYHKFNVIGVQTGAFLGFETPLPGARLTQSFGPSNETLEPSKTVNGVKYAHYHDGIDLAARLGTTVRAAGAGTVIFAGAQSDGCVVVKIRHADGYTSLYGHLDPSLAVAVGQTVAEGQSIGKVGMTGNTTGPHVHFGLYTAGGEAVDPMPSLRSGYLPEPDALLTPLAGDSNVLSKESGSAVLARFDAVASQIPYAAEIRQAAIANGIDPLLLAALAATESGFRSNAVSRSGAMGLTQLMPKLARSLGIKDPYDPQQNLNGGAAYIARQLRGFGRVDMALAAYNAGPGAVGRLGAVPDSKQGYVRRILRTWSSYQELAA